MWGIEVILIGECPSLFFPKQRDFPNACRFLGGRPISIVPRRWSPSADKLLVQERKTATIPPRLAGVAAVG
jgi:hypothetical protein